MVQRYYQPVAGDLTLWDDPAVYVRADLEDELAAVEEIMALSDDARTIAGQGFLEAYDQELQRKKERLSNLIDFFDYDNTDLVLNTKDGKWFTPIASYSVCGSEVDHGIELTHDGLNNTYWQHNADEEHDIIWQLRDYKKRITKLEVRIGSSNRNLLTDLDVYIANNIGGLTSENNRFAIGVNLVVPNSWEEIPFSSKANGQYIRFAGFGSVHANNEVRIQEIRAWVTTVEYEEI